MEAFLFKLAVAVVPLFTLILLAMFWDIQARKHKISSRRKLRARKAMQNAFAAGIMLR